MRQLAPLVTGILALVLCLTASSVVWAQSEAVGPEPNALTRITEIAFQVLTPIVTLLATWFAHRVIRAFEDKVGVDVPEKMEQTIDGWIEQGIHLAEETSRNGLKNKLPKLTGPDKLEQAADFVFDLAQARGWIDWSKERLKAKVEAKLGIQRAGGGKPKLDSIPIPAA